MNKARLLGACVATVFVVTGCGSSGAPTASGAGRGGKESRSLTVFAAASLQKVFTELGKTFENEHPGVKVTFNFAGSSDLVTQLREGAPADVFASADTKNMDKAAGDDLVEGRPLVFASNTLQIAVAPKNPRNINSLADLTKEGVHVVVCAPQVPCGAAAATVERSANVDIKPVSEESSVIDVLNKVVTGEADAGLVYRTDVKGAGGKVDGVDFEQSRQAVNKYPIAVLRSSEQSQLAKQFVGLVGGPAGQQALAKAGFQQAFPVE